MTERQNQNESSSRLPLAVGLLATAAILAIVGKGWWDAEHPAVPPLVGTMDAKTLSAQPLFLVVKPGLKTVWK